MERPWPGSAEILAEERAQCYFLVDKQQSSCEPREIKTTPETLAKSLSWDVTPMHISIPRLPAFTAQPHLTEHYV